MKRKSNQEETEVTAKRIEVDTVSNGDVNVTVCGGYVNNKENAIVIEHEVESDQEALRNVFLLENECRKISQMRSSEPLAYQKVIEKIKGNC